MAEFYKSPPPTNDPNYLGLSKEPDRIKGNTSLGELFEGIGNLSGNIAKFADSRIKQGIMEDAHSLIDPIQDSMGSSLTPAEVQPIAGTGAKGRLRALQMKDGSYTGPTEDTDSGSALGYGPDDAKRDFDQVNSIFPVNDKRPLPPQASREISQLQRMQQAYYAGNLSDSYYNAQLVSVAKQLRAQYPGYRDEVDAAVSQITGIQPANALRASLQRDIQANLAAQIAGANSDQKFIEKHRGVIYALGYDDNTPVEILKPAVGKFLGTQTLQKAQELAVNVNSPEAESILTTKLQGISMGSLAAMGTKVQGLTPLADFQKQAQEASLKGGFDPKTKAMHIAQVEQNINQLRVLMRQAAYAPIEGDKQGRSMVSKMKDGDQKIDGMIEAQLRPWKEYATLVKSDALSALQIGVDTLKHRDNRLVQNLRDAFPGADQMSAIVAAFPNNPIIQNQFLQHSKLLPEFHAAIKNGLGNAILSGTNNQPAPTPSQAVKSYGQLTPEQTNAAYKATADQYDLVTSKENKNTDNAVHVAKKFFTDTTFYDNLSDAGRVQLFLKMAAPSKTEHIRTLAQKDPEVWNAYKEWALYASGDIYRRSSANLQAVLTDPRYNVSFDPKNMVFVDNTKYDPQGGRFTEAAKAPVTRPLNTINNAITWLRPIVGDDMNAILPALGVNPMALKQDDLATQMVRAVGGALMTGAKNAKNVVTQGVKEAGEGLDHVRIKGRLEAGEDLLNPR